MKKLSSLMLVFGLVLTACGGMEGDSEQSVSEDPVYVIPGPIEEMPPSDGCGTIGAVEVTELYRNAYAVTYRVRARNAPPASRVRFDYCVFGRHPYSYPQCAQNDDAPDWSLVDRVDAIYGPNGHWSATITTPVQRNGAYTYFRAKEAKGTSDGAACQYTYSRGARLY